MDGTLRYHGYPVGYLYIDTLTNTETANLANYPYTLGNNFGGYRISADPDSGISRRTSCSVSYLLKLAVAGTPHICETPLTS